LKDQVRLRYAPSPADGDRIDAGQLKIGYEGENYLGYCVDLTHYAGSCSATEQSYTVLNNADEVAYLFDQHADGVANGDQAAALQVAIWEVLFETGPSFDVTTGVMRISDNATVAALANSWLGDLVNLTTPYLPQHILKVLDCSGRCSSKQDVLIGMGYIPEPATAAIFLGGGVLALLRRRR